MGESLYETDVYSWTTEQAKLLRSGRTDLIDITNIAEARAASPVR